MIIELLHNKGSVNSITAEIIANAVISHHGYLHDFISPDLDTPFWKRVKEKELPSYDLCKQIFLEEVISLENMQKQMKKAVQEVENLVEEAGKKYGGEWLSVASRMVYSAVIDADRSDTRAFEENEEVQIHSPAPFKTFISRVEKKYEEFSQQTPTEINRARSEMANACKDHAEKESGIYSLSIPTGGGKTLASLRYALHHAKKHEKKRIIYVVPFTTIIEQNATEVSNILKSEEFILEHHSNVIEDKATEEKDDWYANTIEAKLKLAKDNWDIPIIFTTMVQYLNAFYAYGSRNARRLHNTAESVLIFDEVQKVPLACTGLFNQSLNYLKNRGSSSMILCTATQPALEMLEKNMSLSNDGEIIPDLTKRLKPFERVELIDRASKETINTASLSNMVKELQSIHSSVLVILNTKSVVRKLVESLQSFKVNVYHLSTGMCASHRKEILYEIREKLKNEEPIICVSTQLIEAGVDVDFSSVIRSIAGLDSIAQAAGRCNRHGKKNLKPTYIIHHEEENLRSLPEMKEGGNITKRMLLDLTRDPHLFDGNIMSASAMGIYFQKYYLHHATQLGYFIPLYKQAMTDILFGFAKKHPFFREYVQKNQHYPPFILPFSMQSAASKFEVIESATKTIIVPYKEGKEIISELASNIDIRKIETLLKRVQHYSVNVFPGEWERLTEQNAIESYADGKYYVLKEGYYSTETGLLLSPGGMFEDLQF